MSSPAFFHLDTRTQLDCQRCCYTHVNSGQHGANTGCVQICSGLPCASEGSRLCIKAQTDKCAHAQFEIQKKSNHCNCQCLRLGMLGESTPICSKLTYTAATSPDAISSIGLNAFAEDCESCACTKICAAGDPTTAAHFNICTKLDANAQARFAVDALTGGEAECQVKALTQCNK